MDDARWSALDPSARAFDLERLRVQIEPLVRGAERVERFDPHRLVDEIQGLLVTEYGDWASSWQWYLGERVGAPPGDWCDARTTAKRVLAGVARWRGFLEALAEQFAGLRVEAVALPLEEVVERAAARVLPIVLEWTHADDAWYQAFSIALGWFLEDALGERASEELKEVVASVARARFSSWIGPDDDTGREACAEIGAAVARAIEPRDAIADWLRIRPGVFGNFTGVTGASARSPVSADGHERFIEEVDRPREPARAERMAAALVLCRDSARRGMRLTFDQLAEWQAVVLGQGPVAFRASAAYAKRGRERYKLEPGTPRRFEDALADAHGPADYAVVRAARVYLDVCFFHPFDDGNARAARLALDHVLTSAGLALHAAGPVFAISRVAGDIEGTRAFVRTLDQLVGLRAG